MMANELGLKKESTTKARKKEKIKQLKKNISYWQNWEWFGVLFSSHSCYKGGRVEKTKKNVQVYKDICQK